MKLLILNKRVLKVAMLFQQDCITYMNLEKKLEQLMLYEFNARLKNVKELYDLKGYRTCITEVISLGKRLEGYFDEMKKIDEKILSLIDDETE